MQMLLKDKVVVKVNLLSMKDKESRGEELDTHDPMYFSNLITSKIF